MRKYNRQRTDSSIQDSGQNMHMVSTQDDRTVNEESSHRVFVDAKIMGAHDPALPKKTLVAYVVEANEELCNVTQIDNVDQTDEAELKAVAFCIRELKGRLQRFTILCDNESVVSEILRGEIRPRSRPVLSEIQSEIRTTGNSITVELLGNPADKLLNKYVSDLKK